MIFLIFLASLSSAWASHAKTTEVQVTLLGQPCLIQGPFTHERLKAIHALGPAQAYPNLSPPDLPGALSQAQLALEKIKKTSSLPQELDIYREKLSRRLKSQINFLKALQTPSVAQSLKSAFASNLTQKDQKKFELLLKKLSENKQGTPAYHHLLSQIFDEFNESIEPDPESDFHKAIKKLQVQYQCSFESEDAGQKE